MQKLFPSEARHCYKGIQFLRYTLGSIIRYIHFIRYTVYHIPINIHLFVIALLTLLFVFVLIAGHAWDRNVQSQHSVHGAKNVLSSWRFLEDWHMLHELLLQLLPEVAFSMLQHALDNVVTETIFRKCDDSFLLIFFGFVVNQLLKESLPFFHKIGSMFTNARDL